MRNRLQFNLSFQTANHWFSELNLTRFVNWIKDSLTNRSQSISFINFSIQIKGRCQYFHWTATSTSSFTSHKAIGWLKSLIEPHVNVKLFSSTVIVFRIFFKNSHFVYYRGKKVIWIDMVVCHMLLNVLFCFHKSNNNSIKCGIL